MYIEEEVNDLSASILGHSRSKSSSYLTKQKRILMNNVLHG